MSCDVNKRNKGHLMPLHLEKNTLEVLMKVSNNFLLTYPQFLVRGLVTIDCPQTRRMREMMRKVDRMKMKGRLRPHLEVHSSDHLPIRGTV